MFPWTSGQLKRAIHGFGRKKSFSFTHLKNLIDQPDARFSSIPDNDTAKLRKDVTGNSNGASPGSYILCTNCWEKINGTN